MTWKDQITVRLARTVGIQIVRQPNGRPGLARGQQRLLESPVFLLSSMRSGSTLLRMILDSHSAIYAPPETHLATVNVVCPNETVRAGMAELGFTETELTGLLWDSVLHTALQRSGKTTLVEKTPHHVLAWDRIARCWPDARFIFLLRHPAAILDSWARSWPDDDPAKALETVQQYVSSLRDAMSILPGHTVRYEDLVSDPEPQAKALCDFLGVGWEPAMLEYGRFPHGKVEAGLGDWSDQIRTGTVQAPRQRTKPVELPADLRKAARDWGYSG
jgi:hypothetical protein